MKTFLAILCFSTLISCSMFSINSREAITKPLTAVDSDREVVLSQNHLFRIVLPSNPTTGYSWNVSIDDSKIVAIESSNYVADNSGRVGVGGETTWVLMTHNKGNARLIFSYQRPWEEKVAPTRVVTFSINVR